MTLNVTGTKIVIENNVPQPCVVCVVDIQGKQEEIKNRPILLFMSCFRIWRTRSAPH